MARRASEVTGDKNIGFPNNSDSVLSIDCLTCVVYTIGSYYQRENGKVERPIQVRFYCSWENNSIVIVYMTTIVEPSMACIF